MIRRVLFFMMISVTSYAQDTVAVIDTKFPLEDFGSFSWGDSTFIRVVEQTQQPGVYRPNSAWYYRNQRIADVNLTELKNETVLAVQHYSDTVYYYGNDQKGQKSQVQIFRSIGLGKTQLVGEEEIEGKTMGQADHNGNTVVITFSRKKKTFKVYELQRTRVVMLGEVTIPWNIDNVENRNIALISGSPNSSSNLAFEDLKGFFYGNTLSVAFDDDERDPQNPNSYRKTVVIRKDLVTGQQKSIGFRLDPTGLFGSYLDGNNLYRLLWKDKVCKIIIHDLDANKVIKEFEFPIDLNETPGNNDKQKDIISKFGLAVDNFNDQKMLTVGIAHFDKKFPIPIPLPIPNVGTITILTNRYGPTLSTCKYYIGSPQTSFTPAPDNSDFGKIRASQYELTHQQIPFDYTEYSMDKNSIIAAYKLKKSTSYTFLKFSNRP